jgi:hypothetical protein
VNQFKELVPYWQKKLHLMNWRIVIGRRRPSASLAEVEVFTDHMIARIHIGRDWGNNPPKEGDLEKVVIHELLHVLLWHLAELAEKTDSEKVAGVEHAIIIPLAETLYELEHQKEKPA